MTFLQTFSPLDRFAALKLAEPEEENPLDRVVKLLEQMLELQQDRPGPRVSAAPS